MDESRYRIAERAMWASVGASPTERLLALDRTGATVRVQEVGAGPPVVFVHGASNAGTSWAALVARLHGHRCVLVDRPGCGLSPPLGRRLSDMTELRAFADDLAVDVIDALGAAEAPVVATSFGGYFGLRAAAAHPARVARLFLLGWSLGARPRSLPLFMRVAMQPMLGRLALRVPPTERVVRSMLKQIGLRGALESGRFGPTEIAWFQAVLRDTPTMRNEIDALPPVITLQGVNDELLLDDALLASVQAPTYFLWGAEDPMGGPDIARAFRGALSTAQLEILDSAGHAPWIDDPDHVAKRLTEFLGAGS